MRLLLSCRKADTSSCCRYQDTDGGEDEEVDDDDDDDEEFEEGEGEQGVDDDEEGELIFMIRSPSVGHCISIGCGDGQPPFLRLPRITYPTAFGHAYAVLESLS